MLTLLLTWKKKQLRMLRQGEELGLMFILDPSAGISKGIQSNNAEGQTFRKVYSEWGKPY